MTHYVLNPQSRMPADVSVCMACYNGASFLREQIDSILREVSPASELVVVDDYSSDNTVELLESYQDGRIRIFKNDQNRGVNYSFERALSLARHDTILLADQDDVWLPGRVKMLTSALEQRVALLASSNMLFMDGAGRRIEDNGFKLKLDDSDRHYNNIVRIFQGTANYYGCAMALRRSLLRLALPIPRYVESHDLWLAMAANLLAANAHVESPTLIRRIHGSNASVISRGLAAKLVARLIFLRSGYELWLRKRRLRGVFNG